MRIFTILGNTKIWLTASIIAAIFIPVFADTVKEYVVTLLVILMAVSMRDVSISNFDISQWKEMLSMLFFSYVLFAGFLGILVYMFIPLQYQPALFMLALVPPSIGLISLSDILGGDLDLAVVVEVLAYVAGIVIIPLATFFLFDESVAPLGLFQTVFTLLILPFMLSRGLHYIDREVYAVPEDGTKIVFNLTYFFIFYGVIGSQVNRLFAIPETAFLIALILVIARLGLGFAIFYSLKHKVGRELSVDYMLFGSFKSGGAALGFTILIFGPEYIFPFAVNGIVVPLHVMASEYAIAD